MSKKQKRDFDGIMFSTDEHFEFESASDHTETLPPQQQKLRIRLETKQRGGKKATLISGFVGTEADHEALSKLLKAFCGTGGSITDGEILIQGDMTQKVKTKLQSLGYKTNNI